ncbi:polysaccharide pyruvyl transferase family protein [Aureimonas phyllosphaerae]|nr:polysaccharide pyruvyl transferase family protein [Aureimonas phyllosphaerae]
MEATKTKLLDIKAVCSPDVPVVYLDYPVYDNIGDLLIHQGGEAFLRENGYNTLGQFSIHEFARRVDKKQPHLALKPSIKALDDLVSRHRPTIIMQGGGNFGDIWPEFQQFREMIVSRYPDSKIVIFPQSIHFHDAAQQKRAASLFGAHKNLHIFVRDAASLDFVRDECGLPTALMPDMAHQLWGRLNTGEPGKAQGVLVQERRDKESRNEGSNEGGFDWDELFSSRDRFMIKALRKWQIIDNPLRQVVPNYSLWRPYRDSLVSRATERFRPYAEIYTDRLHGMILGALLGKTVRYTDGNYGKLHRYANLWFQGSDRMHSALGH